MTRIFDAWKKSDATSQSPVPGHGVPVPTGRASEIARDSLPLLGALPISEDVLREMSALRVTLESTLAGRSPRVVMFLGPQGGEGTSTVALQFAQVLSRDVMLRPLIVDCHARRPAYAVDASRRCAVVSPEVLPRTAGEPDVVTANLFVVPVSDAHRVAGIIQPAALRETIDANSPGFDWVLLDGPPVLEAPDSAALGAVADGAVVVIQVGRTRRPVLNRAADLLSKAGARLLGSVLNRRVLEIPEFIYRRI
jgi:Mrp family chromosome partitioning ATPase